MSTIRRGATHPSLPSAPHPTDDDVVVTVALTQDFEWTGDGAVLPAPFGITLGLADTSGSAHPDGGPIAADVLLSVEEAERLGSRLFGLAGRARTAAVPTQAEVAAMVATFTDGQAR